MQNSSSDCMELVLARRWIEECTGCIEKQKGFREYLQDGTLLCELVQRVRPDLIKRIKRVKSPFAWRENLAFFLEACKSLGLKGSQLFCPEDLISSGARTLTTKTKGFRGENERKLRNVAITVFWLSRVVQRLPDYTGPLLDFDLSTLGDWEHSVRLSDTRGSNQNTAPAISTSHRIRPRSYTSPDHQPHQPQQSPPYCNKASFSSLSSPPLPTSPHRSPTIQVKRVESTVSHTEQSSYPQVIIHVGRKDHSRNFSGPKHSRSNSLTDSRTVESTHKLQRSSKTTSVSAPLYTGSLFDQLDESEKILSDLTQELTLTQQALEKKQRTSTPPTNQHQNGILSRTRSPSPDLLVWENSQEQENKVRESASLQELINTELQENSHKSPLESRSSPLHTHRSPSVSSSTPSEVSTIVPRTLSRCSRGSFPEDTCITGRNSFAEPDSHLLALGHRVSASETNLHSASISHPLLFSSSQSINHQGPAQEEPTVEVCGSQVLYRNSQFPQSDTDTSSEPQETDSEASNYPSLRVSSPSPQPVTLPNHPSITLPLTASSGVLERHPYLDHTLEEEHNRSESDSLTQRTSSLTVQQRRTHPVVASLREDYRKSFHSSSSSLDSTACSVIEVSYCYNTADTETAPSNHLASRTDTETNTASSYSSSSENENDAQYKVFPSETLDHFLTDLDTLEAPDTENSTTKTTLSRYHSLPNFEQVDLETIPEEMSITTQVMRIYPAQSVGEISSNVTVPHHCVHIPSSSKDPESPSKHTSTAHGILGVSPPSMESQEMKNVLVKEDIVTEEAPPDFMATEIHVLQDEEGDEDLHVDTRPEVKKVRPPSGTLASDPAIDRVNLTLAPLVAGGGGSLARVVSDALPLTLHADMLTVPDPAESKEDQSDDLADFSDFNSTAVEIGSSLDSLSSSKVSLAASHQSTASLGLSQHSVSSSALGSHSELHVHIPRGDLRHHKQRSDDSFIASVLAPSQGAGVGENREFGASSTKKGRPMSAPTRATSDSVLPLPLASSSPSSYSTDSPKMFTLRNRRTSAEDKRQQRLANITESARAALTLSAIRRSKKTESLPRDSNQLQHMHQHSGSKSVGSEEELLGSSTSDSSMLERSPGPGTTDVKTTDSSSPSPSFNLNRLSMDDTRKASLTEMEEIWKLVENESESSAATSVDTGGRRACVSGGGMSRGPPSIALERHVSPQHVSVSKQSVEKNERPAQTKLSHGSPLHSVEEVDGRTEIRSVAKVARHDHTSLDVSETEMRVAADQVPRQSTPKKPGLTQSATPKMPIMNGGHKPSPVTKKDIDSLLTTLRSLGGEEEAEGHGEEMGLLLLEQMLHSNTFKRAQKVHDTVAQLVSHDESAPKPVTRRVVPIAQEARHHFHHHTEPCDEVDELRTLLRDPHMQALMFCHDRVSSRDYYLPRRHYPRIKQDPVDVILSASVLNYGPVTSLDNSLPLSRNVPSTRKEDATIVYLQRSNRPLGCTIYKQGDSVFVGKLLKGCDAELSEVLREGDELLEVNGVPVIGRSTDEIIRFMSGEAGATLAFTIIPIHDDNIDLSYEPKYVRAHFNYSAKTDSEIPCQPLGLKFEKGDILEISNQDDPDWWQARKVFDDGAESLPGLIPARHRQQQREALTRSYPLASAMEDQQRKKKGLMSKLSRKKKKTVFYNQGQHSVLAVGDEVVTYEDVARMEPHPHRRRPIVLIGASGIGKGTLIRKLLNSDHNHFAAVVQHTTRPIHPGEVDGHTYHFVTREEFELDILHERFLEHEEVKGHLYGTSVSAIKKIMESGRVPVLGLQPQSLKRVRYSGLMPYVVFVASPRLERLVVTRRVGPTERPRRRLGTSASSSFDMDSSQIYTEPELQHLLLESRLVETQYSHYFDWIIVNDDLSVASDMLKEVARRAEEETHWVPASWLADHSF